MLTPYILIANGNNNLMINLTSFYNLLSIGNSYARPKDSIIQKLLSLPPNPQEKTQRHANAIFSLHIHNP